jgi:hypothetical protein
MTMPATGVLRKLDPFSTPNLLGSVPGSCFEDVLSPQQPEFDNGLGVTGTRTSNDFVSGGP